jgi:3-phenylpropionate/trans-cinnamate dioxygenase ferredoxin reductase subunit
MTTKTLVTVGAGQTAAVAARTLRGRGFDGRIVLIGDEPYAPYQRPPLSKEFLSGTDSLDSMLLLPQTWLANNDVEIVTGTEVTRVDPGTRAVELAGAPPIVADAVLFATGGRPRTLPVPGSRPELVHYLRTVDDAQRLQRSLAQGRRLVLIGAGFIGLEIAATASILGVDVVVLEAADVPLSSVVGAQLGEVCARLHRDNGIDIRTRALVSGLRTTEAGVVIDLSDSSSLEADDVVVGIGITPNVAVAAASGLTTSTPRATSPAATPKGPGRTCGSSTSTTPTSKAPRSPTRCWAVTRSPTKRAGSGRTSTATTSNPSAPQRVS